MKHPDSIRRPVPTPTAPRLAVLCAAAMAVLLVGCAGSTDPVQQHRKARTQAALHKVMVVPFYPDLSATSRLRAGGPTSWDAATLVGRFFSEELYQRLVATGGDVIPPSDTEGAFAAAGQIAPRQDVEAAIAVAHSEYGATSIVMGRVERYRERSGEAGGSLQAASVAFEVSLYSVPEGQKIWTGRFDHSQSSMTANLFQALRYPGRGTRWLTVAELASWGAKELVESLLAGP